MVVRVLIDWTGEFDRWYDRLIERADTGEEHALQHLAIVDAELGVLQDLQTAPEANTTTLRRVSQWRRHAVWPVAHPFVDGTAMRLIVPAGATRSSRRRAVRRRQGAGGRCVLQQCRASRRRCDRQLPVPYLIRRRDR
jgi:hypothetical protein